MPFHNVNCESGLWTDFVLKRGDISVCNDFHCLPMTLLSLQPLSRSDSSKKTIRNLVMRIHYRDICVLQ